MNILEISNTLGIAKQTLQDYIFLLENTYCIRRLRPFHKNIRSELSKMPKIFFEDTGLANLLTNKTFSLNIDGNLLETSIYSQLRKNLSAEDIYFWRTTKKQEVDFVIDYVDRDKKRNLSAIEVKSVFLNKHTVNLRYFKREYKEAIVYLCCINQKEPLKYKNLKIIYPWQIPHILNLS